MRMRADAREMKPQTGSDEVRYRAMIGVGGIGAGSFFALSGNHTLGREESRGGRFLDRNDYCKLHIVSHYVQTLLGPDFTVLPVGKVGDDDVGKRLLAEMRETGMDMRRVQVSPGDQTLFSFCFVYPDGSGGNMTTDDSACSKVDAAFVAAAAPEFARFEGRGIALALPEVPIEAREALLELGTKHGFLRIAGFNSEEIAHAATCGTLARVDLLAINLDEAAAVAGVSADKNAADVVVSAAVDKLTSINTALLVSVTAGDRGSWVWDGRALSHAPAFKAKLVSSAGAGDAHLSGIIVGLVAGLPLSEAQQLGALTGALSVTSPHTINKDINRESLYAFAQQSGSDLPETVRMLLEDQS